MVLSKNSRWYGDVIIQAFSRLDKRLTTEEVMVLSENSEWWHSYVMTEALKQLDGFLTIEEVMVLSENSRWNRDVIIEALKHLDRSLTINWDLFYDYLNRIKNKSILPLFLNQIPITRANKYLSL